MELLRQRARKDILFDQFLANPEILSATVPRWWTVTPGHAHSVALRIMDYAENAIAEASMDPVGRAQVLKALENHAPPARTYKVERLLEAGEVPEALEEVTPSEMFEITAELSADKNNMAPVATEIRRAALEFRKS